MKWIQEKQSIDHLSDLYKTGNMINADALAGFRVWYPSRPAESVIGAGA